MIFNENLIEFGVILFRFIGKKWNYIHRQQFQFSN